MQENENELARESAAAHLKFQEQNILQRWESGCRKNIPVASQESRGSIRDSLPNLFQSLRALLLGKEIDGTHQSSEACGEEHARDRARESNFSLGDIIFEYQLLRECLIEGLESQGRLSLEVCQIIHNFLDRTVRSATLCFLREQEVIHGGVVREKEILYGQMEQVIAVTKIGFFDWDIQADQVLYSETFRQSWTSQAQSSIRASLQMIHREDRSRVSLAIEETLANGADYQIEYRIEGNQGAYRWVEVRGKLLKNPADNNAHLFGTVIDITDRKEIELNAALVSQELARSLQELKVQRELRERFVVALTHDLQTPLTAARISAGIIIHQEKLGAAFASLKAAKILEGLDQADRMIRDLLDANRINAGQGIPIHLQDCDLNKIARRAIDAVKFGNYQIDLDSPEVQILGIWDNLSIQRVIENLLSNAIKYGDNTQKITVRTRLDGPYVSIAVHNFGPVIPEADAKALFQQYHRSDAALVSGQKGWGIGLSLVKGILAAHGGAVHLTSSLEAGTTFEARMPLNSSDKSHFLIDSLVASS